MSAMFFFAFGSLKAASIDLIGFVASKDSFLTILTRIARSSKNESGLSPLPPPSWPPAPGFGFSPFGEYCGLVASRASSSLIAACPSGVA